MSSNHSNHCTIWSPLIRNQQYYPHSSQMRTIIPWRHWTNGNIPPTRGRTDCIHHRTLMDENNLNPSTEVEPIITAGRSQIRRTHSTRKLPIYPAVAPYSILDPIYLEIHVRTQHMLITYRNMCQTQNTTRHLHYETLRWHGLHHKSTQGY